MDTATQILVIIVSVLLSLTLLLGIVVSILTIGILRRVKRVVAKAEQLADTASNIGDIFENVGGRLAVLRVIQNIVKLVNKK